MVPTRETFFLGPFFTFFGQNGPKFQYLDTDFFMHIWQLKTLPDIDFHVPDSIFLYSQK